MGGGGYPVEVALGDERVGNEELTKKCPHPSFAEHTVGREFVLPLCWQDLRL